MFIIVLYYTFFSKHYVDIIKIKKKEYIFIKKLCIIHFKI